jgi:hypothetical protein
MSRPCHTSSEPSRLRPGPRALLVAVLFACVYMAAAAPGALGSSPTPGAEGEIPVPEAVGPEQSAATDQTAAAASSAVQQEPTNLVVTIRINSPGDDGPISQTNVVVGVSDASNTASETQTGEPGDSVDGAPDQAAATDQAAGATATATQDGAQNIVVVVRVNSPGDSGPISQENTTVAVSDAGNDSTTNQRAGSSGEAAPPAARPEARSAGGSVPAPASRRRAPAPATRGSAQHATAPAASSATVAPTAHTSPETTASSPARGADAHRSSSHARAAATPRPTTAGREREHGAITARAADLLGSLTPPAPTAGPEPAADVSGSVIFSLLAALGAAAGFLAWPLLAGRLPLAGPRRRLGG